MDDLTYEWRVCLFKSNSVPPTIFWAAHGKAHSSHFMM